MEPESLPLLGRARQGRDVYEVREGDADPVEIWRMVDGQPRRVGYVEDYELRMACAGHTPNIAVGLAETMRLAGKHFRLRQAVADFIRKPDPDGVVDLAELRDADRRRR